jgi:hypothetical protein
MKINVKKFKTFIQKATLNNSITNVRIMVDGDSIKSSMIGQGCITIVDLKNDIIGGIPYEVEMNFNEPKQHLETYLDLIDDEMAEIDIKDQKIILKSGRQKSNIFYCSQHITTYYNGTEPKSIGETFHTFKLDNSFLEVYDKIRKIAGKFNKVYFSVENNEFYMETTDKTNKFSNGIKFALSGVVYKDVSLCFDFKNINALMTIVAEEADKFTVSFRWVEAQKGGMLSLEKDDGSEKYYIVTHKEE